MKNIKLFDSIGAARTMYSEILRRTRRLGGYKLTCGFDEWCSSDVRDNDFRHGTEVDCAAEAAPILRDLFEQFVDREAFVVMPLDAAHRTICDPLIISQGLLNGTPAGAREVFREAVMWDAAAVVVAHNHPSGDPTPSKKDISLTKELVASGKVLRIPVLDHIVIGDETFVSIREDGYCPFGD